MRSRMSLISNGIERLHKSTLTPRIPSGRRTEWLEGEKSSLFANLTKCCSLYFFLIHSFMFLAFIMSFLIRTRLAHKNKQREQIMAGMTQEERELQSAAVVEEIPDYDVRYRFMT